MASIVEYGSNVNMYWNLIKNLDADLKLDLIDRMINSLRKKERTATDNLADNFYGVWKDEKPVEELAKEIRASRHFGSRKIEIFD